MMTDVKDSSRWLYAFNELEQVEERFKSIGDKSKQWENVRGLLGGKGANLARMTALNLPVPPGFIITTEACLYYMKNKKLPDGLWDEIVTAVKGIEQQTRKVFDFESSGRPSDVTMQAGGISSPHGFSQSSQSSAIPLLLSCRSGAKFSMPGMMDTVLNIGLNDQTVDILAALTNERFVWDAYRRLIQGFASVVMNIDSDKFEDTLKVFKQEKGYETDLDLSAADWKMITSKYKALVQELSSQPFPQSPFKQLEMACIAVFGSWNSKRAIAYRNKTKISHELGTACNIQAMVFGNMGDDSATGVAFTRSPSTGEKQLFGDYLTNAQGEDVVAGIRNCTPVAKMGQEFPQAYDELLKVCDVLEHWFRNMQDIEFTIENSKLWMLQCRDGKRTAKSQVRIALDMVKEKLISRQEAVKRVSPDDINVLLLPQLDEKKLSAARNEGKLICSGINASFGGAVGKIVFDADRAEAQKSKGEPVILVRPFTRPEDVHGFFAACGILTSEGGATSHAAVVARQFGIPCICGASNLLIDLEAKQLTIKGKENIILQEGDVLSLDATRGDVYMDPIPTVDAKFEDHQDLREILDWADQICQSTCVRGGKESGSKSMRGLQVWANADTPKDAQNAKMFGAKGIGLCRTEHMFFEPERLPIVQRMILAASDEDRRHALGLLLPFQRHDFLELFRAMDGYPVIIRTLDPPLHEFLPNLAQLKEKVALLRSRMQDPKTESDLKTALVLLQSVEKLHESNPMMGLRGVRLGLLHPAITEMQIQAIAEAACLAKREGIKVFPEIMIPLICHANELSQSRQQVESVIEQVLKDQKESIVFKIGTMIETPRAALTSHKIASIADFYSFGTNDLTQMTFGMSRDDAEREFLMEYVTRGVLDANPFQSLDEDGVGRLIAVCTMEGRSVKPELSVGICGEHGGDPLSVQLCHKYGLDYVSCSAFRVPCARLAAALAVIAERDQAH